MTIHAYYLIQLLLLVLFAQLTIELMKLYFLFFIKLCSVRTWHDPKRNQIRYRLANIDRVQKKPIVILQLLKQASKLTSKVCLGHSEG